MKCLIFWSSYLVYSSILYGGVVEYAVNVYYPVSNSYRHLKNNLLVPITHYSMHGLIPSNLPITHFHAWIADELHIQREAPSTKRVNWLEWRKVGYG